MARWSGRTKCRCASCRPDADAARRGLVWWAVTQTGIGTGLRSQRPCVGHAGGGDICRGLSGRRVGGVGASGGSEVGDHQPRGDASRFCRGLGIARHGGRSPAPAFVTSRLSLTPQLGADRCHPHGPLPAVPRPRSPNAWDSHGPFSHSAAGAPPSLCPWPASGFPRLLPISLAARLKFPPRNAIPLCILQGGIPESPADSS